MEVEKFLNMCDSASDVLLDDICPDENLVEHSGIFGMKWGNRRYQNEDGTYTEEGKKRRRKTFDNMSRAEKKAAKKALKKARDAREEKAERKEAVQRGDIRYAQMNFDKFSEDEITELYRRYDMKREIDRINTQKSQETLDKWVNRLDSAGKMARSVDSIYTSLNNISETNKNSKAAESRRKLENKKSKLTLEEQKLRNDNQRTRNKVEEEYYSRMLEETKDYRDKLREYELNNKRLSNEKLNADINKTRFDFYKTKAETQKTVQETRNSKSKALREYDDWKYEYDKKTAKAAVADPYAAKEYQDKVERARSSLEEKLDKELNSKYRYATDSSAVASEKSKIEKEAKAFVKKYSPGASKAEIQSEIDYRISRFDDMVNEQKRNYNSERSEKIARIDAELPLSYVSYLNSGGTPFTSSAESDKLKSSSKEIKEMRERIYDLEKMLNK